MQARAFGMQPLHARLRDALGPRPDGDFQFYERLVKVFADACRFLDDVYGHIHFPTCWCVNRLPASLP